MKAFFEEYGFVLVSIVVVMLLVTMTGTVGDQISTKVGGIVDGFSFADNKVSFTMPGSTPVESGGEQ